jgi:RNA polymerase sigma-70 factor (ECF subfamily)
MTIMALSTTSPVIDASAQSAADLITREEGNLRRFMRRYIADDSTIDDILQEVSIKVLKRLGSVREKAALRGWLFQVTRNACLDYLRKQDRQKAKAPLLDDGATIPSQAHHNDNPMDRFVTKERIAAVHAALSELPDSQREVIRLRLEEGLDHEAISERLNISRQAVEVRLCRGRSSLKERLDDIMQGDL